MPPAPIRVHDSVQHREERVNASVQRPWDLALHVGPVVSCAPLKGIRIARRKVHGRSRNASYHLSGFVTSGFLVHRDALELRGWQKVFTKM